MAGKFFAVDIFGFLAAVPLEGEDDRTLWPVISDFGIRFTVEIEFFDVTTGLGSLFDGNDVVFVFPITAGIL